MHCCGAAGEAVMQLSVRFDPNVILKQWDQIVFWNHWVHDHAETRR